MPKYFVFTLFLIVFAHKASAQTDSSSGVWQAVDQMPFFSGCAEFDGEPLRKRACSDEKLVAFLSQNLVYPPAAVEKNVEGTAIVSFIVEADGRISAPIIVRDLAQGCGEAALKVVKTMPRWEPGRENGQAVRVKMNLPIRFAFKKQAAKNLADGLELHWGRLLSEKISKAELLAALDTPISVRDAEGNSLKIVELAFLFDKKKKTISAALRGTTVLDKAMRSVAKKASSGGSFSVSATVQQAGQLVNVEKTYLIAH